MTHDLTQLPLDIRLREDATFANYVGESARQLRDATGIIYVWGEPGTGRSHLLQAACREADARGVMSIYLVDMERHVPEVLRDLERLPLVCLDDIHQVLGRSDWETELFHLVNAVRDGGGTLILSGNRPVARLPVVLADLRSRLVAARAIETAALDDHGKLELLKQRAASQGFELADEVGRFIMSRSDRSTGSLVRLLERLETETLRRQQKVTIPLVKQVLGG